MKIKENRDEKTVETGASWNRQAQEEKHGGKIGQADEKYTCDMRGGGCARGMSGRNKESAR
jgi:hypothetical protein